MSGNLCRFRRGRGVNRFYRSFETVRDYFGRGASGPEMKTALSPQAFEIYVPRRRFLRQVAYGAALFAVPGLFAEELALTPRQTEGPFYPDVLPLDTDNDLVSSTQRSEPRLLEWQNTTRFFTALKNLSDD